MLDKTKNLGQIGSAVLTFIGYNKETDTQAKGIDSSTLFLYSGCLVDQNWLISVINNLVNPIRTFLYSEIKNQASNRQICEVLVRLCSLIVCGCNSVYVF